MNEKTDLNAAKNNEDYRRLSACRICLALGVKLYNMKKYKLSMLYEELTDLIHSEMDKLPQDLCWECTHRLLNYEKFKAKATRTQDILLNLLDIHNELTDRLVSTIDRESRNLNSNLCTKLYKANHSDVCIQCDESDKNEIQEIILEEAINIKANDSDVDDIKYDNDMKTNDSEDDDFNETNTDVMMMEDTACDNQVEILELNVKSAKRKLLRRDIKTKEAVNLKSSNDNGKIANDDYIDLSLFDIKYLSQEEQLDEIAKRKLGSNYKNSPYKCEDCYKGFLHKEVYERHAVHHTELYGSYQCKICKIRTKKRYELKHHSAKHQQKYICRGCPFVTGSRSAAHIHGKYHNGKRYTCGHCGEIFEKNTSYMSHLRTKHPSDIVCALCGHSFVSKKGLVLHTNFKHKFHSKTVPKDGPACEECNIVFVSGHALDTHMSLSTKHNKSLDTSIRRRVHKKASDHKRPAHHKPPEGPIPCEQCDMELPNARRYDRHFRKLHPGKNRTKFFTEDSQCMCEICGQMFRCMSLLKDHYDAHNSSSFECGECGKRFPRRSRLVIHERVHATRPLHSCAICGRRFTVYANMIRHRDSVHMNLKKFDCNLCGKKFKQLCGLRTHIDCYHHKQPWPKRNRKKASNNTTPVTSASIDNDTWEPKKVSQERF
ncbi:zinc finger protein 568-like isoform X2 [Bombyx mandarina]|uniref:Zinc finger protein 568-like isoform X2 n=1 Tax=Bombyx mandarina TaxID=7092 RepID=A0A6J2JR40_BOMMA|nr:zinc finger protein 568-like isoform X2 [Bombyx mandarina]